MKYPPEVQAELDKLAEYASDGELAEFNILHLYPQELAYPNGFYDSRFFNLIGFNTRTMKQNQLGKRDGLHFQGGTRIDIIRIFLDGSTLVRFKHLVRVDGFGQAIVLPT